MNTIFKKIKKLDQFSEQFNFFIHKKSKQKQTLTGGIFSLIICIASMCYLGYLLFLYFGNRLLPKITSQTYISTSYQELKTDANLFGFSLMLSGGVTLEQLQQKTGKQYVTFLLQHSIYQQNQMVRTQIPINNCQDSMFLGLLCIDLQNQPDSIKTLFQNPNDLSQSFYHLTVSACQGLPNCASPEEIYDLIFQDSVAFIIKIKINQFNYITQQFEETYKFDYLQFDDTLSIEVQYVLRQSKNIINQGLIFQNPDTIQNIQNFQRITTYFSKTNLLQKAGFEGYAHFQFEIDQIQQINNIQFPLVTESLAQFLPILNFMLIFGGLAKLFASKRILEDLNILQIKEYYKETGLELISQLEKSEQLKNDIAQTHQTQAECIYQQNSQLQKTKFKQKFQQQFKIGFLQFLKQLLLRFLSICRKKKHIQSKKQIYEKLMKNTAKKVSIYQVYKDLIQLKMAIKLLMTTEQYAALQFCGCELKIQTKKEKANQAENIIIRKEMDIEILKIESLKENIKSFNQELSSRINNQNNIQSNQIQLAVLSDDEDILSIQAQNQINTKDCQEVHFNSNCSKKQKIEINTNLSANQKNNVEMSTKQQEKQIFSQIANFPKQIDIKNKKNHLQEIDCVLNNQEALLLNLKLFIEKINESQDITDVDLNIYSSLISSIYQKN
ncbi:hypothetical protein ABPG72_009601 [Tetrahymena utriculariae]